MTGWHPVDGFPIVHQWDHPPTPRVRAAIEALHAAVVAAGLPWRTGYVLEPGDWVEWFGSGGQGHEPARFMLSEAEPPDEAVWAYLTADESDESTTDHLGIYRRYIELNGFAAEPKDPT